MPDAEKKPIVPRGKALERTPKELDKMTSIEALKELAGEAADDWRENAPRGAATLLDSKGRK